MTQRLALIGYPLRRRHSEVMHNAAFRHFEVDAKYELRELAVGELRGFFAEVRQEGWLGFQVTAPYKQAVMEHLDDIEDDALAIGAVNSGVSRDDGGLVGFNTDAPGFRRAVEQDLGVRLPGIAVVVAGAGGAARAVVHALVSAGAGEVIVGNRTASRARDLATDFGDPVRGMGMDAGFEESLGRAALAVNATSVGMTDPGTPFDVGALPVSATVFDLIYTPPESELLRRARARGLRAANGLGMLVAQAGIAFERWTGVPDAAPVMRAALAPLA
jgi:shikimate dehydrogenase